jgi:murein DD-endopeptidase MepM/ murein hydrolase activator NlpD
VQPPQKQAASGDWTSDGGTAVVVKPGENISMIARRHGVSVSAIASANNLGTSRTIYAGQRLIIPHHSSATARAATTPRTFASAHPAPTPASRSAASLSGSRHQATTGVHIVEPGDTLSRLSRRYGKSISEIARANHIEPYATLKIGERITIPGVRISKAEHKDTHKVAQAKPLEAPAHPKAPAHTQVASAAPTESAAVVTPASETPPPTTSAVKAAGGPPSFRWPVKGRVIAGFGPKTNGQQNDGINLAVPEGTPIKAAEDGVVAYAGNELKGYGNLVLVRHAHGYVTAYAHASKLLVKRGDHIKRGQVIAKAGQTGNVDAPQLHFEIRKGPSPLDPLPLLRGS